MKMIDLYIQEVTKRLPDKSREDIALELRSTIEDMLPDDYTEKEVKAVLMKLGNPAKLANNYLDKPRSLIGPAYYGIYLNLLKMILPIAAFVALTVVITDHIVSYDGKEAVLNVILDVIGLGIWRMIGTAIQTFFWLTVVFAIIERVDPVHKNSLMTGKEWTPDDLELVPYIDNEKRIPSFEVFGGLLWTAIWAIVFFSASSLVGIYEKGPEGLVFVTPTFNQDVLHAYWPLVAVVIGFELANSIWKYITRHWTIKLAVFNCCYRFISSIAFVIIITNPRLVLPEFKDYMTEVLSLGASWETWTLSVAIFTYILFAGIEAAKGIRKAKSNKMTNSSLTKTL